MEYITTGGKGVYIKHPVYKQNICIECPFKTETCKNSLHCEGEGEGAENGKTDL